jgi:hypothetical protein
LGWFKKFLKISVNFKEDFSSFFALFFNLITQKKGGYMFIDRVLGMYLLYVREGGVLRLVLAHRNRKKLVAHWKKIQAQSPA